jgi:hypothetical protein
MSKGRKIRHCFVKGYAFRRGNSVAVPEKFAPFGLFCICRRAKKGGGVCVELGERHGTVSNSRGSWRYREVSLTLGRNNRAQDRLCEESRRSSSTPRHQLREQEPGFGVGRDMAEKDAKSRSAMKAAMAAQKKKSPGKDYWRSLRLLTYGAGVHACRIVGLGAM